MSIIIKVGISLLFFGIAGAAMAALSMSPQVGGGVNVFDGGINASGSAPAPLPGLALAFENGTTTLAFEDGTSNLCFEGRAPC